MCNLYCNCYGVYTIGECCIRAGVEDQTNGFFVAVFERIHTLLDSEEMTTTAEDITIQRSNVKCADSNTRTSRKKRKCRHLPVTSSR